MQEEMHGEIVTEIWFVYNCNSELAAYGATTPYQITYTNPRIHLKPDLNNGYREAYLYKNTNFTHISYAYVSQDITGVVSPSIVQLNSSDLKCIMQSPTTNPATLAHGIIDSGNQHKLPGSYTVTYKVADGYMWNQGFREDKSYTWVIDKLNLEYQPYVEGVYKIPAIYQNNQWIAINSKVR